MDRLLCHEVTGFKLDGDDFASDSDDESASSSRDRQLLDSPFGAEALTSGGSKTPSLR